MKTLAAISLALCALLPALAQYPERAAGPLGLVIAYRVNPDHRAALRDSMVHGGVARFEGWKTRGVLKDYHILFNTYLDSETYDMVALLEFAKYSDVIRWQEIERESPGGLSPDLLRYVVSAITSPIDVVRSKSAETLPARGRGVYFLIPYDYLVSTDDYLKYVDGYVIPQVNGWIAEDVLADYRIGIGRYSTSRAWSSLFILEYRDAEAFGKREATVNKVRERLRTDPAWKAISDNKQKVRIEKQTIIAEELVAR